MVYGVILSFLNIDIEIYYNNESNIIIDFNFYKEVNIMVKRSMKGGLT